MAEPKKRAKSTNVRVAEKVHMSVVGTRLEDWKPGLPYSTNQLRWEELSFKREDIYEWAKSGLSMVGMERRSGVQAEQLNWHFRKTIERARADRALEALALLNDKADSGSMEAIKLVLDRVDPVKKDEPTIVIAQQFNGVEQAKNINIDDLNDL